MFGKRTGFIAAAAAVFLGSVLAQIPDAFSSGFKPQAIQLKVAFGSKDLKNGDTLTPAGKLDFFFSCLDRWVEV